MGMITWSEEYSVGIARMDEEHQELFKLIEKLNAAMASGQDRDTILEVMDGVLDYIRYHFESEEKFMQENEYTDFEAHRQSHIDLTLETVELRKNYSKSKNYPAGDISDFLIEWLAKHIMGVDKRYGRFMNSRGIY